MADHEHVAGYSVSRASYQKRGCRCDGCVDANAAYIRALRDRDRARYNASQRACQGRRRIGKRRREAIEQAIARDVPGERICTDFDLTPEQLQAILAAMLDGAA